MIEVNNITKVFPKIIAVNQLSFTLNKGQLLGIAGINGAGKTTTLRIISGLLKPTTGNVKINGIDIRTNRQKALVYMSFLTGDIRLYGELTPKELLTFIGKLRGKSNVKIKDDIEKIANELNFQSFLNKQISKLSGGTKQKVSIASTIISDSDFIVMDEPFNELDVPVSIQLRKLLISMKKEGKGILISSHNLHILKHLCDNIMFIHNGKEIKFLNQEEIAQITDMENYFMESIKEDIQ